jgi:hypothetical protein
MLNDQFVNDLINSPNSGIRVPNSRNSDRISDDRASCARDRGFAVSLSLERSRESTSADGDSDSEV